MDEIVTAALVGTARMGQKTATTAPPIDDLLQLLGGRDRERSLLLQAGAFAIYREAGQVPVKAVEPLPMPAPPETQPLCSRQLAALLELLVKHHTDLLPEALDRMNTHNLCVSPDVLPIIFGAKLAHDLRPALRQIIGETGRWLAQFNKSWSWATEAPLAATMSFPEAEMIWQEGGPTQRIEVLRWLRAVDAAKAREWIINAWRQERSDLRVKMLETLDVGLAADDEALLEGALDDRVEAVRGSALTLLARLPDTAYARRMQARADEMVLWKDGQLTVKVRRDIEADPAWVRDGLPKEPARKTNKTDWALSNVLQRIPLSYWQERCNATPVAIIVAAQKTDHAEIFLLSWTHAAQFGNGADWVMPLWEWWMSPSTQASAETWARYELIPLLSSAEAEQCALQWIPSLGENSDEPWSGILSNIAGPWSEAFGHDVLVRIIAYLERRLENPELVLEMDWTRHLNEVALHLPPSCFATALVPIEIPDRNTWQSRQWRQRWGELTETITLRQRIAEEIA